MYATDSTSFLISCSRNELINKLTFTQLPSTRIPRIFHPIVSDLSPSPVSPPYCLKPAALITINRPWQQFCLVLPSFSCPFFFQAGSPWPPRITESHGTGQRSSLLCVLCLYCLWLGDSLSLTKGFIEQHRKQHTEDGMVLNTEISNSGLQWVKSLDPADPTWPRQHQPASINGYF